MATTTKLGLYYPVISTDGENFFNTDTMLRDNWIKLDGLFHETTGHKHDGTAGNGPLIGTNSLAALAITTAKLADLNVTTAKLADQSVTAAKIAAKTVGSSQLADGAASDGIIGNRTITDTTVAAAGADSVTGLFSKLGYMIKAITGKTAWYTAPAISLETVSTYLNQNVRTTASPKFVALNIGANAEGSLSINANGELVIYNDTGMNLTAEAIRFSSGDATIFDALTFGVTAYDGINFNGTVYIDPDLRVENNLSTYTFTSRATTGTKPLNIGSQTMVDNLNADMVDGLHGTDLVKSRAKGLDKQVNSTKVTIASYTPKVNGNYLIGVYLRVVNAATTVSVQISYLDNTGNKNLTILSAVSIPVGSSNLAPVFINASANWAIDVSVSATIVNNVFASASIVEL